MSNAQQKTIDGFYVAYFTGAAGNSYGMFVFREGVVTGADAGGGRYDGEYQLSKDGTKVEGKIKFFLTAGNASITGAQAGSEPISIEVPIQLPVEIDRADVYRIETPIGPINAKFDKVRGF